MMRKACSLLAATADGHRAGPGTERISGTAVALSPSAAGDGPGAVGWRGSRVTGELGARGRGWV